MKKSVHSSEYGGVHFGEVHFQQKSLGGTSGCSLYGGVHFREVKHGLLWNEDNVPENLLLH